MAALIQLSNHPASGQPLHLPLLKLPKEDQSPGWTHWINSSKYMKVQESRVRSGRRKYCSACCCRSSKAQSCYQPAHTQLGRTQKPQGTTTLVKTQRRTPPGLNNILKVNMTMLASGGNEIENRIELQQSLSYYYHTDFPSKLLLCFPIPQDSLLHNSNGMVTQG